MSLRAFDPLDSLSSVKFKRVLIGRESDLPPVHSGLEECFAICPSFSSPGNLPVETESRARNLDTFSIPETLFLESHHVTTDHPHWRTSMFPEFRKRGNGKPISVPCGYDRGDLYKAG